MASKNRGQFVWHEYLARDVQAAVAFYTETIGWKTQPFGDDYVMWVGTQGPLGGVFRAPGEQPHKPLWIGHVQVDDVDTTAARASKLGGRVWKEPTDIPTVGRFAVLADPQGAPISVFKPAGEMGLHDLSRQGEFSWNELLTSDSAAALRFHSELFGWQVLDEMDMGPMGTYRIFGIGAQRLGGMINTPKREAIAPTWMYYVNTTDVDAALGRATTRGAKVLSGPMEVPGGGRIVQLLDPQGAAIALHQGPAD